MGLSGDRRKAWNSAFDILESEVAARLSSPLPERISGINTGSAGKGFVVIRRMLGINPDYAYIHIGVCPSTSSYGGAQKTVVIEERHSESMERENHDALLSVRAYP